MTTPTITIDDKKYAIDQITAQGKEILGMIQATEMKLAELNRDLAIAQTAKTFYIKALAEHLPKPLDE
jgi:hypothetical protein